MAKRKKKATASGASIIDTGRYKYETVKVRGSDGKIRHSAGNGDAVAKALLGTSYEDQQKIMKKNGLADKFAQKDFTNHGQFRMALGSALRGLVRNGTEVTIGDHVIKSLAQKVSVADLVEKDKKPRRAKAA